MNQKIKTIPQLGLLSETISPNPSKHMRKLVLFLCLGLIGSLAYGQETATKEPIYRLFEVMKLDQSMDKMLDMLIQNPMIVSANIPEEVWDEFRKEFNSESMMIEIAEVYQKYYSPEEISALIDFYNTPIGQKTIELTPLITGETMQIGQRFGLETMQKVLEKLEKMGYTKTS